MMIKQNEQEEKVLDLLFIKSTFLTFIILPPQRLRNRYHQLVYLLEQQK